MAGKDDPQTVEYETKAKNLLKSELKRKGVTYAQLAEKLATMDIHETERNLNNKISRGALALRSYCNAERYRGILIAAFGVVLLGAALPPDERKSTPAPTFRTASRDHRQPCCGESSASPTGK
ncbi:DUF6471 domain-containing protein [Mesorhizobium sp. M0320]|uniref:DUF6471 domain-containing protein n=1 Tax=Mesorhizobium sp. M0320 TaxID=2956936 RepID=UPI00333AF436